MSLRLVASVSASHVHLQLRAAGHSGLSAWLPSFIRGARRRPAPETPATMNARAAFDPSPGSLSLALQGALAQLREAAGLSEERVRLEAQLGLAHAAFGFLRLGDTDARTLPFEIQQTYVHAWIRGVLHLDPSAQLVRWQVQVAGKSLLVSCVSRNTFETLQAFCSDHRMTFASCLPAALDFARAQRNRDAATIVWTEGLEGAREGRVQMLRFDDRGLCATWRGWIPPSPHGGSEEEVRAAARRFEACHGGEGTGPHIHLCWPACALSTEGQ